MEGLILEYPEDSIQSLVGEWWLEDDSLSVTRGRLIKAFVPHVSQEPRQLEVIGRDDPEKHSSAAYEIKPLRVSAPIRVQGLPVAALPPYPGEVLTLHRAKVRPCLILSEGGPDIPKALRTGAARWQSAPALLCAPAYGVDRSGTRGGWRPEFVRRIRRCEYPQYVWDCLPIRGATESILRLDHAQPVGRHYNSFEATKFRLSDDALQLVDEWLQWLLTGSPPKDGVLMDVRSELSKLDE